MLTGFSLPTGTSARFSRLVWTVVLAGCLLRLAQYLHNRSLWLDEVWLASSLIDNSFTGLFGTLANRQFASIGFLLVEKAMVVAFGSGELALRLFPLLCGLGSVVLFYQVGGRLLSKDAGILALCLFAVSPQLIYYSSELKPYSTDLLVALLVYLGTYRFLESKGQLGDWLTFGLIGLVALWFSYPAVFLLAGIHTALFLYLWLHKQREQVWGLAALSVFYGANALVNYLLFLRVGLRAPGLRSFYERAFPPFPPASVRDFYWYLRNFFDFFSEPLGFTLVGIAGLAMLVGAYEIWRSKRMEFCLLLFPLVVTLAACAARFYPFQNRLLLFLAPSAFFLMGAGARAIYVKTRQAIPFFSYAFLGLLFLHPLLLSSYSVVVPQQREEFRSVLENLRNLVEKEDTVYIFYQARFAYSYYARRGQALPSSNLVVGIASRGDFSRYVDDINKLRGRRRVWFVFAHSFSINRIDEEPYFLVHLNRIGKRLHEIRKEGASAYLYDLSTERGQVPPSDAPGPPR